MEQLGEQQINDKLLKKIAPDVISDKGRQELLAKQMGAHKMKDMLDRALAIGSTAIGATFSSRVKELHTMQTKIAQKRIMEPSRGYGIDDIGDALGGRLVVNSPKDYDKGEEQIREMEKQGIFKIKKVQDVKTAHYHARHFDVVMPNGLKAEIQLHTKHSEGESNVNHQIRAEFGEKPDGIVKALRDKQSKLVDHLHPDKAKALTHAIQLITKQDGKAPDHLTTAKLIKNAL